jgi:hypothetical protein
MGDILDPLTAIPAAAPVRARWRGERWFHVTLAVAITGAVVLGFARTFFLRSWFPEWAQVHGAPEPIFYVHGALFTGWFVLLMVQPLLVARRRIDLHRKLGWAGAVVAVAMVVIGTYASLIAARRPTGFIDIPMPPLQFLVVPLSLIALFAIFVGLAIANRKRPQHHKRYMLLASIALIEAGVGRWPFAIMEASPLPGYSMIQLGVDLFLVPMVLWDLATRGRVHPVTLWGGVALVAMQPLRMVFSGSHAWLAFAAWAVGLLPG